jgi:hypothetical protein
VSSENQTKPKKKDKIDFGALQSPGQWTNLLTNSGTAKSNGLTGIQLANNQGYFSTTQFYANVFGGNANLSNNKLVDIGDVIIKRFYVKVTVKDFTTKTGIDKAIVQAKEDGNEKSTTANGVVVINDAKGSAPYIIVNGPPNSDYIPQEVVFDIKANKDTAEVIVELKKGTSVSGKVLLNGNGVKEAQVFVDGKAYIKVKTDDAGNYKLALPDGEYIVKAAKQGLQGDLKTFTIASTSIIHDFNLTDPGFDASKLLGFDIELYESKAGANANEKIISGAFIKIPDNSLFKVAKSFKLPFNNIKVNVIGNKARPIGDSVLTTVSEIPLELFEYLPLKLKSSNGIKIKQNGTDNEVGKIVGFAALDISTLLNKVSGLSIPLDLEINLSGDGADKKEVTAFMSNGAMPLDANNLKLLGVSGNSGTWKLYGTEMTLNYDKSYVFSDGLQLAGSVRLPSFPVIGNKTFLINQFKINTGGDVNFDVACNLNEEINFSAWKLRIGLLKVSNFGVNIGGMMGVTIPETDKISISFSNLNISSNGVGGGQFNLYSQLIADQLKTLEAKMAQAQTAYNNVVSNAKNIKDNAVQQATTALNNAKNEWQTKLDNLLSSATNEIGLFKIVTYSPVKNVNFCLSKIPGKNDYKIEGGGVFGLKKYIDDKIKLNYFALATDGNFAFDIPLNMKHKFFEIAEIELSEVGYDGFKKTFTVGGKIYLKVPGFGIGGGTTIVYYQDAEPEVKEIAIKMDIGAVGAFEGGLTITGGGFRGNGKLKLVKAFEIGGSLVYEKDRVNGGIRFGVDFNLKPAIMIPVGVVSIGISGGGFEINTSRGNEKIIVKVTGNLKLIVDPAAATAAIDPLTLSIEAGPAGPILKGTGIAVAATINVGQAGFVIDYPNKYLTFYAEGGFAIDVIPSAPISAKAGFRFSASFASGHQYMMAAMYQEINIANVAKAGTNIAFAWGASKYQGPPEENQYLQFIPDEYLTNGKVFGFGFSSHTSFGIKKENKIGVDFKIASVKGWYFNESWSNIYGNFKDGRFGFQIGTHFEAGGEVRAVGILLGSAGVKLAGDIGGGYGNGEWFANVNLEAEVVAKLLCCDDEECKTKLCWALILPCGAEFCLRGYLGIGLSSRTGAKMSLRL